MTQAGSKRFPGRGQVSEVFEGAAKTFFNILLNQVQDGVYCLDKDRRIVFWGRGAEMAAGFERAEVMGKQCPEDLTLLVDHEDKPVDPEKCPIVASLRDGTIRSAELYLRHKDGYRLPVSLRVIPVVREDGEIIGAAEVFTDMSPKLTLPMNITDLERQGLVDTETGIPGRKFLDMHLAARLDIVANKLRLLVAESYISVETGTLGATVSMGACLVQRYDSVEGLIKRAEQLMMHSKWRGRNKVSMSFVTNEER